MTKTISNVLSKTNIEKIKVLIDQNKQKAQVFDQHPLDKNGNKILFSSPILIKDKIKGRIMMRHVELSAEILSEINTKIKNFFGSQYELHPGVSYFEYSKKHGNPKLSPHKDLTEEYVDLHADYQLESNTDWALDVNGTSVTLKDNELIIFDGSRQIHSRPFKKFNDGEFVKMILFRFSKVKSQ